MLPHFGSFLFYCACWLLWQRDVTIVEVRDDKCLDKELNHIHNQVGPDLSDVIQLLQKEVTDAIYSKVSWTSHTKSRFFADFVAENEVELNWILMLCWTEGLSGINTSSVLERDLKAASYHPFGHIIEGRLISLLRQLGHLAGRTNRAQHHWYSNGGVYWEEMGAKHRSMWHPSPKKAMLDLHNSLISGCISPLWVML